MTIHVKYVFLLLLLMVFFVPSAYSEDLEIKVEKLGKNLFKLDQKPILIQTQNCASMDKHQDPFLKINDSSKKIHFRQPQGECEVKAAYKRSTDGVGSYAVVIQYETEDWYAISNTDSYIRTKKCASLAQGKKAVLSLNGAHGALHIDKLECLVEGVYTKLE